MLPIRTTLAHLVTAALAATALGAVALAGGCDSESVPAPALRGGATTGVGGTAGADAHGGSGGSSEGGTGGGGSGGGGGAGGVCDPPLAQVAPSGTDDIVYANVPTPACFEAPCLCDDAARILIEHLLACDPVAGGFWAPEGSTYLRVAGREGGACVVEVGLEVEGGIAYERCHLPLPIEPWLGIATESDPAVDGDTLLAGIEDRCELAGTCCVLPGCPDPCETELPDVPQCPLLGALACD